MFVYYLEYHSSSPRLYTLHPTLYTLHSTPYAPSWLSCARRWSAVSSFAPPVGSVFAATPRVLLCLLPTGSPMTPASWGVRRMSFGYFWVVQTSAISRRASSCQWLNPRRIRRVNPRLFCLFIVSNTFEFSLAPPGVASCVSKSFPAGKDLG